MNSRLNERGEDAPPSLTKLAGTFILFILTASYFTFLAIVPGRSDWLFLLFWLITFLTIYFQVYKIRSGVRSMAKDVFFESSFLHRFFAKKSLLQAIVSLFLGVIISLSFLITLKLMVLKNGFYSTLIIIILPVIFVYATKSGLSFSIEKNMKDEQTRETVAFVITVFIRALIIAFYLALVFSSLDTVKFFTLDNVGFFNFAEEAAKSAIPLGNGGHIVRTIVNFAVIVDTFSFAAINELIEALGLAKSAVSPALFLLATFILNLLKLVPFCIAYVFVVLSLEGKLLDYSVALYTFIKGKVFLGSDSTQAENKQIVNNEEQGEVK